MAKSATPEIKLRSIKVDDASWGRWQAEAKAGGTSLTALIIQRMSAGPAVTKAKIAELEADILQLEKSLVRVADLEDEVKGLTQQRDAANGALEGAKVDIEQFKAARARYDENIKEMESLIAIGATKALRVEPPPKPIDLDALEREWRRKWEAEEHSISPRRALAVFRGRPEGQAIDPKAHHVSGPVLASAVPDKVEGQAQPFFKPKQRAALEKLGGSKS